MGERKHKAEDGEKKDRVKFGTRTNPRVAHPILQLQQLVGNKTVTKMIQRQTKTSGAVVQRAFKNDPGYKAWLGRLKSDLNAVNEPLNDLVDNNKSGRKLHLRATSKWSKMRKTFKEGE